MISICFSCFIKGRSCLPTQANACNCLKFIWLLSSYLWFWTGYLTLTHGLEYNSFYASSQCFCWKFVFFLFGEYVGKKWVWKKWSVGQEVLFSVQFLLICVSKTHDFLWDVSNGFSLLRMQMSKSRKKWKKMQKSVRKWRFIMNVGKWWVCIFPPNHLLSPNYAV